MAKKKQELTSAELLEEALVREEDWPYEVPGNWVWTRLGSVAKFIGGGTPSKSNSSYWNGSIPWASVKDIKGEILNSTIDKITEEGVLNSSTNVCEVDDLLLITRIEPGKSIISKIKTAVNQDIRIVKTPLSSKFMHYFMLTKKAEFISNASGSTVLGISIQSVAKIKFPLPPLAEQQRIVDRIESLFDQLDQAKDLIQDALDSFENRKAAILHQAFTGQLTKKWRAAHGVGVESWEEKPISEYIISLNQGWSPKCESFPSLDINEWGVIKTTAIQHMEFNEIENKQLPKHLEPKVQHELIDGDILITRAGPRIRVGVCCLVKNVRPKLLLCDKAYRIRLNSEKVLNEFFVMQLNTNEKLFEINKMKTGISDSGVNLTQKGFLEIQIKVPPLKEQQEIVRILDDLFEKEQNAKDLCDLIDQIETIKKTILGQAFRGELGTNVVGEESVNIQEL